MIKMRMIQKTGCVIGLLISVLICHAQKKKISLKDSLDHKFDLSDYIIDANGFVPVPFIITEPALGGFGGGIAPIFMKKNRPYRDSTEGHLKYTPIAPTITGAVGIYTVNKSWILGAFRSGVLRKARIKYRIAGGYANVNMSFYRTLQATGELEFKVNTKSAVGLASGIKRLGKSNWYAGLQYLFLHTEVTSANDQSLPSFIKPLEMKSNIAMLSAIIELDSRDNVFTPDKGIKFHVDAGISDNIVGSDYDFWKINYYAYMYKPFWKKFVGGLRIDGQQALSSPPFYFLPFIDMRGVPAERYQGKADILAEGELRYDVVQRWSLVFFGGTGKAFDEWSAFSDAKWVASGGLGFRYLLARKFKLRMGVDLARGPDTWAYYIVFGSNWLK
jgi:hypothetical protein